MTGVQTRVDDFGTKRIAAVETPQGTIKTDAVVNCAGRFNKYFSVSTMFQPSSGIVQDNNQILIEICNLAVKIHT